MSAPPLGGESGTGALMGRITRPGHRIRRQPLGDPGTRAVLRGGRTEMTKRVAFQQMLARIRE